MLFEIDENRTLDAPLTEGKIIHADHPRGRLGRSQGTAENAQDHVPTERHAQTGSHPCTGFAACLAPEHTHGRSRPDGALRVAGGERGQAFGKGLARTRRGGTAETPDL